MSLIFSTPVIPLMDVDSGIIISLIFLIDFQKAVMSLCDNDVARASTCAGFCYIAWHCLRAYLKNRRVDFIRSHIDLRLGFPKSRHMI